MKEEVFRRHLVKHRKFLKSLNLINVNLSRANSIKIALEGATDQELRTLVRVLHFYSTGSIPISAKLFQALKASKLIGHLRKNVEKKRKCL